MDDLKDVEETGDLKAVEETGDLKAVEETGESITNSTHFYDAIQEIKDAESHDKGASEAMTPQLQATHQRKTRKFVTRFESSEARQKRKSAGKRKLFDL
jgi:hypothetical protein